MSKSWWISILDPLSGCATCPIKLRKDLGGSERGGILGIHIEYTHLKLIRGPYRQTQMWRLWRNYLVLQLPPLTRCGPYLPVRVNNLSRLREALNQVSYTISSTTFGRGGERARVREGDVGYLRVLQAFKTYRCWDYGEIIQSYRGVLPPLIRCGPYLPIRTKNFSRLWEAINQVSYTISSTTFGKISGSTLAGPLCRTMNQNHRFL